MCVWVCRFFFLLFTWHFLFAPFPFFIFLSLIRPCSCECVFAYFKKLLIPGGCLKIQSIVYVCLCIKCFLTAKKKTNMNDCVTLDSHSRSFWLQNDVNRYDAVHILISLWTIHIAISSYMYTILRGENKKWVTISQS